MDARQSHDDATPLLFDTAAAARRIDARLSPRTMERWRRSGYGPRYVLIGRRVGYTDAAISEWLAQQERHHTQQGRRVEMRDSSPQPQEAAVAVQHDARHMRAGA